MRSKLEPWETALLCQLWHGVEVNLMDEMPKTPAHLLRVVKRRLEELQWEVKPRLRPGHGTTAPDPVIKLIK